MNKCPFCGATQAMDVMHGHRSAMGDIWKYCYVRCNACKAQGPYYESRMATKELMEEVAIDRWNRRRV